MKDLLTKQNLWTAAFAGIMFVGTALGANLGDAIGAIFGIAISLIIVGLLSVRFLV